MSFNLFEPIFDRVDEVTVDYVADFSSNMITALTPFVTTGLSLAFIFMAIAIIQGAIQTPIAEFLKRSFMIALIVSIAMAGGFYQTHLADLITTVPDSLAATMMGEPGVTTTAASMLDQAATVGFDRAGEAFDKVSLYSGSSYVFVIYGATILGVTILLLAIGGAYIILAKVALAILAGFGPMFILALLFKPTYRFFELWLGQVANYGLLIVLFSAVFTFIMTMFTTYMDGVAFDGVQNTAYTIGGVGILGVASLLLLVQLPGMASGLASGVGLGFMWQMAAIRRGIGSTGRPGGGMGGGSGSGSRVGRSGMLGAAHAAGSGSMAAGRAAGRGMSKAAGYFKGRKAA